MTSAVPRYTIRLYHPAQPGYIWGIVPIARSARYRMARNDVGDFEVVLPWIDATERLVTQIRSTWLIEFWLDDRTFVFGGQVRRRQISSAAESGLTTVTYSGPSYLGWLASYRMLPATGSAPVVVSAGHPDDMVKQAVRDHVVTPADPTRAIPWMTVATNASAVATAASYSATAFDTVLETAQAIATRADKAGTPFCFDVVRDSDMVLRFKTWAPIRGTDRSLGVSAAPVLLDLRSGNVQALDYVEDGSDVENAVWALGTGDLAARYRSFASDTASIATWGRIEGSVEVSGQAAAEVDKKRDETLQEKAPGALTFTAKAAGLGRYTFGRDFDFGDKVTAADELHGIGVSDEVTAAQVTIAEDRPAPTVDLTIGRDQSGSGTQALRLANLLRSLRRQIGLVARPSGA
jgi:hypothetical protein